jgi:hypothetical protein
VTWRLAPKHRGWKENDHGQHVDTVSATVVAGSALLLRAEDLFAYPLLETTHYYSETWPCYHMHGHGRTLWYCGDVKMIHHWHASHPQGSPADQAMEADRALFRKMCDEHEPPIPHD